MIKKVVFLLMLLHLSAQCQASFFPPQLSFEHLKKLIFDRKLIMQKNQSIKGKLLKRNSSIKFNPESYEKLQRINQLLSQGALNQADTLIQSGLNKNPKNFELIIKKAELSELKGNYQLALNLLLGLPEFYRNRPFFHGYQAYLNLALKNFQESKYQYQLLMKMEPNNALWRLGLANAQDLSGEPKAALKTYQSLMPLIQDMKIKNFVQTRISTLYQKEHLD